MYSSSIFPDFRKITALIKLTDEQISIVETAGGVPLELDYMDENEYNHVCDGLKAILEKYELESHYTELLYLLLKKNEQIRVRYDAYWQNYDDDLTSSEVAKFLLAYKTSNPKHQFHLTAKPLKGSVTIKDSAISRWMAETIYNRIESRDFPLGLFGEKIIYDLFGPDLDSESISLERLEATANLKPKKPTVRIKKLYSELCLYLQVYLNAETDMKASENVLVADSQANLFFDLLELLGYLRKDRFDSEPKDYIYSMLNNNTS